MLNIYDLITYNDPLIPLSRIVDRSLVPIAKFICCTHATCDSIVMPQRSSQITQPFKINVGDYGI